MQVPRLPTSRCTNTAERTPGCCCFAPPPCDPTTPDGLHPNPHPPPFKHTHQAEEAKAKEEADKVGAIKQECENDLAEAMPAFNAAIKV